MEEHLIWRAPEFEYHEKGPGWYWLSTIVAVVLVAIAVYMKDYGFALFIVLCEVMFLIWAGREPQIVTFRLTDQHLHAEDHNKSWPLSGIAEFSITECIHDNHSRLFLKHHHGLNPETIIIIPTELVLHIRARLGERIPEVHHEESWNDIITRILRF